MNTSPQPSAWSSPLLAALGQAPGADGAREPVHPALLGVSNTAASDIEIMYRKKSTEPAEGNAVTDLEERLRTVVAAEQQTAALHAAAVSERDAALLAGVEAGLTFYRLHKLTGLAQSAVAKSVRRARERREGSAGS